jgi:hypothetical protein
MKIYFEIGSRTTLSCLQTGSEEIPIPRQFAEFDYRIKLVKIVDTRCSLLCPRLLLEPGALDCRQEIESVTLDAMRCLREMPCLRKVFEVSDRLNGPARPDESHSSCFHSLSLLLRKQAFSFRAQRNHRHRENVAEVVAEYPINGGDSITQTICSRDWRQFPFRAQTEKE